MDSFCAPAQSARKVTIRRFLGLIGVIPNDRLCENYVHGSTALTTNEMASLESKYLSARPELSRRVPIEFSHSLSLGMTTR